MKLSTAIINTKQDKQQDATFSISEKPEHTVENYE